MQHTVCGGYQTPPCLAVTLTAAFQFAHTEHPPPRSIQLWLCWCLCIFSSSGKNFMVSSCPGVTSVSSRQCPVKNISSLVVIWPQGTQAVVKHQGAHQGTSAQPHGAANPALRTAVQPVTISPRNQLARSPVLHSADVPDTSNRISFKRFP